MCGICGYINCSEKIKNDSVIKKMTSSINKKETDKINIYVDNTVAFGHTKVNLIDLLTSNENITYEYNSNKYTITYNGELYNSNELKKELIDLGFSFKTNSDSEITLVSYIAYKEKCLDKLNGIFSFAIYSPRYW